MRNAKVFSITAIADVRRHYHEMMFVVIIVDTTRASYVKLHQHIVGDSLYISVISGRRQIASCMCKNV